MRAITQKIEFQLLACIKPYDYVISTPIYQQILKQLILVYDA